MHLKEIIEMPCTFPSGFLTVTPCLTIVKYHKQEIDTDTIHRPYSGKKMLCRTNKTVVLKLLKEELINY